MTNNSEHPSAARAAFDKASTAHAMAERALAECTKIWLHLGKPAEPHYPPSHVTHEGFAIFGTRWRHSLSGAVFEIVFIGEDFFTSGEIIGVRKAFSPEPPRVVVLDALLREFVPELG